MHQSISKKILLNIDESILNIKEAVSQIEELSKLISNKFLEEKGRIIFVGTAITNEIIKILINESWINFKVEKNKFIILSSTQKSFDNLEELYRLEEISSKSIFELDEIKISSDDMIIGFMLLEENQYILSAIKYANDLKCHTTIITDGKYSKIENYAKKIIKINLPESFVLELNFLEIGIIQKIILNILFYNTMNLLGRIYNDFLIFMQPISIKKEKYCINVIKNLLNTSEKEAKLFFKENENSLELTLITKILNINIKDAKNLLIEKNYNANLIFK